MKTTLRWALSLTLLAGLMPTSEAFAGQITATASPFQIGSGGEFSFKAVNPDGWLDTSGYSSLTKGFNGANSFQTFCIEFGEQINLGGTYNAQLNDKAMFGGVSGGDPVSAGTGWLYSRFAQGILTNYNYGNAPYDSTETADRKTSADLLQNTLWWLEGETHTGGDTNIFGQMVIAAFGGGLAGEAAAKGGSAATYGVYAVNTWTGSDPTTNRAQDGLFFSVPDGGATLMLLGGAMMGLGIIRRKFSI